MKKFLRLLNFEFERLSNFFYALAGILITSQVIGSLIAARSYMAEVNERMYGLQHSTERILTDLNGPYSVADFHATLWFLGPLALCIIGLSIYAFFIWYREWLAKHTFAYRLLMLPMNRMMIYFSKIAVLLIAILTLFVIQLLLIGVTHIISAALIAEEFYLPVSLGNIIDSNMLLFVLFPKNLTQFFLTYGTGVAALMVTYTSILIERTYGVKGFVLGLLYGLAFGAIILLCLGINRWFPFTFEFYTSEVVKLILGFGGLFALLSYGISTYLLNRKITI